MFHSPANTSSSERYGSGAADGTRRGIAHDLQWSCQNIEACETMAISFEGRVAIVTGAGNGVGRAHALGLAARGLRWW